MFISRDVNTVDVESMFSEFGPKMYIKVNKDMNGKDSLAVTANKYFASPVANWSVPFYMAGYANQEANNTIFYYGTAAEFQAPLEFPVEMSADKNTIVIKGFEANGTKYYPNVIGEDYSQLTGTVYILEKPIISDVVLTRGWTDEPAETPATRAIKGAQKMNAVDPVDATHLVKYGKRTKFEKMGAVKKVDYEFIPYEQLMQNLEKYKN